MNTIKVTVPGRICLFGEHQDYLGLPVITYAINLNVSITGKREKSNKIFIDLPDINSKEEIILKQNGSDILYIHERDYFRSAINVLNRLGASIITGCRCRVNGNIPINSGTSSSSALNVAWIRFLVEIAENVDLTYKDPLRIAHLAYQTEVLEFKEPGGMMDQFATAVGGTLYISFLDEASVKLLDAELGSFVLGDSGQPKDTKFWGWRQ